ncbi:AAA family ATPase [Streptomyces sp. NPDC059176]|uniref:AAA family ATPase n=1 Tax=Streptomyces sp. NPDC059176 TaxID=3346758 RepID=UPI0036B9BCD6
MRDCWTRSSGDTGCGPPAPPRPTPRPARPPHRTSGPSGRRPAGGNGSPTGLPLPCPPTIAANARIPRVLSIGRTPVGGRPVRCRPTASARADRPGHQRVHGTVLRRTPSCVPTAHCRGGTVSSDARPNSRPSRTGSALRRAVPDPWCCSRARRAIGKSTLAAEALRRYADSAGFTVVRGHCPRDAAAPPLWPWQRVLRLAGVASGSPARRTASMTGARTAAGQQPWGATALAAAVAARFLELAAMTEALAVAASERPLVVLLEDLHWADTASLDLLRQVTSEADECGLFVIGTFREPGPEEAAGAFANLGRYGAAVLRLEPFTREEVAQCVGEPNAAESY